MRTKYDSRNSQLVKFLFYKSCIMLNKINVNYIILITYKLLVEKYSTLQLFMMKHKQKVNLEPKHLLSKFN